MGSGTRPAQTNILKKKIHFTIPKFCDPFFPFLNFIIEIGTGSRLILLYLNLQVIGPYWIMSLVFESETEM